MALRDLTSSAKMLRMHTLCKLVVLLRQGAGANSRASLPLPEPCTSRTALANCLRMPASREAAHPRVLFIVSLLPRSSRRVPEAEKWSAGACELADCRGPPWLTSSADARPSPRRPAASPETKPEVQGAPKDPRATRCDEMRREPLPGLGLDRLQRRFLVEGTRARCGRRVPAFETSANVRPCCGKSPLCHRCQEPEDEKQE